MKLADFSSYLIDPFIELLYYPRLSYNALSCMATATFSLQSRFPSISVDENGDEIGER